MSEPSSAELGPGQSAGRAPHGLGARIREARLDARLSIRELARAVDVSSSFVSQVELGRAAPSIGTLYAIATHLGLSLDNLMSAGPVAATPPATSPAETPRGLREAPSVPHSPLPRQQLAAARPAITLDDVRWERLTAEDDNLVEFLRIVYPPGSESCPPDNLQRHDGWEYGHILTGALDVEVAFSKGTLATGDSIDFNSTTPHRLSNPYDNECVAIWVVIGRQSRTIVDRQVSQSWPSSGPRPESST